MHCTYDCSVRARMHCFFFYMNMKCKFISPHLHNEKGIQVESHVIIPHGRIQQGGLDTVQVHLTYNSAHALKYSQWSFF